MPPSFPVRSTAVQNKIKVEKLSQQAIHSMIMAYLGRLDLEQAGYEDFLNLFRLAIRKSHEEKLRILEKSGVDSSSIRAIKQNLDEYEVLVNQVNDNKWLIGHTSPVSGNAMLAINMNRNSINKNPQLLGFIRNYFQLLGKITSTSNASKKSARDAYLAAFSQTGFPKYFNAKTVANTLYPLRPDAFPLINDYVEGELKKHIGAINLTPQGYIEAANKMDDLLSQISSEHHFGIIDRTISHMIENPSDTDMTNSLKSNPTISKPSLNQILYGPPGTGKTYHTVTRAIQILDPDCYSVNIAIPDSKAGRQAIKERFDEFVNEGRIRMTTFHQSFSYEDFVEGIKAVTDESTNQITYKIEPGVFKQIVDRAIAGRYTSGGINISPDANVWKISIDGTGISKLREDNLDRGEASIGWGWTGNLLDQNNASKKEQSYLKNLGRNELSSVSNFADDVEIGDIFLCISSAWNVQAVGVVTSEYRYEPDGHETREDFKHFRTVNWILRGVDIPFDELNGNTRFTQKTFYHLHRISALDVLNHLTKHGHTFDEKTQKIEQPYVLIIDEINRGNISRVFGELITLLEPSKRDGDGDNYIERQQVILPYSKKPFFVPSNLYLIGTMNTADKSLAQIDIALRRRFDFEEMVPDHCLLGEIEIAGGINIGKLLEIINKRIEVLLGRDYMIGHSYFMTLTNTSSLEELADVFSRKVIPLLQEYFFEDWERIRLVLNDHRKAEEHQLIRQNTDDDLSLLFGDNQNIQINTHRYYVNAEAFQYAESFAQIVPDNV